MRSPRRCARHYEPGKANELLARYGEAFSGGYRDNYPPAIAAEDVRVIESLSAERPLGVHFHRPAADDHSSVRLKIWSFERPLPLSERVPVLENMGFSVVDERTYRIEPDGAPKTWFHEMLLRARGWRGDRSCRGARRRLRPRS